MHPYPPLRQNYSRFLTLRFWPTLIELTSAVDGRFHAAMNPSRECASPPGRSSTLAPVAGRCPMS